MSTERYHERYQNVYKENAAHQRVSAAAEHWQPHTTAVKMALNTNAQTNCNQCLLDASHTICAYIGQNTITIVELLYF